MSRGSHHPTHGVNPAAARLQAQQERFLRGAGVGAVAAPVARVTWRSSYEEVVADFTARPLASHCSCEACLPGGKA